MGQDSRRCQLLHLFIVLATLTESIVLHTFLCFESGILHELFGKTDHVVLFLDQFAYWGSGAIIHQVGRIGRLVARLLISRLSLDACHACTHSLIRFFSRV